MSGINITKIEVNKKLARKIIGHKGVTSSKREDSMVKEDIKIKTKEDVYC